MKKNDGILVGVFAGCASLLTAFTMLSSPRAEPSLESFVTPPLHDTRSAEPKTADPKLIGKDVEVDLPERVAVTTTTPHDNEDFKKALKEAQDYIAKIREEDKQKYIDDFAQKTYEFQAEVPAYEEDTLTNQQRRQINAVQLEQVARIALAEYFERDEGNLDIWGKYMNENTCLVSHSSNESRIDVNGYAPSIWVQEGLSSSVQISHAVSLIDAYLKIKDNYETQPFAISDIENHRYLSISDMSTRIELSGSRYQPKSSRDTFPPPN